MNYKLLKDSLDLKNAIDWLTLDSADDFFPDPLGWADIKKSRKDFIKRTEHRILQADRITHITEYVPKKSGMLREAVWLHPEHRILYLAILKKFLQRLDSRLCKEVYSYRSDSPNNPQEYPFTKRMDRWKNFHNDFRRAALEDSTGAILITDIASYFDHININQLGNRIISILAASFDGSDNEVLQFLLKLLCMWGCDGFGMPHNYDASSFFGSLYLHNVDCDMKEKRYRYFRWLDDIRIVAKSREQALRAIHDLQASLARHRLFLATDKTDIYEKNSKEYNNILNIEDNILLSEAEETITRGLKNELEQISKRLFARIKEHSKPKGDERKFRAFANRLLDVSDFQEVETDITNKLHDFVIPRLKSYPERSDYWVKMLSVCPTKKVSLILKELLVEKPSMFDWQRFHLWRLATSLPTELIPGELFDKAIEVSSGTLSDNVVSQSIVFLGRHSDNTKRENLFNHLFTSQRSYIVQRAILIAIQELPTREYYYKRALEINSEHQELINYITKRETPNYGIKTRSVRHCQERPRRIEHIIKRGIGISKGSISKYRLSRYDYDY